MKSTQPEFSSPLSEGSARSPFNALSPNQSYQLGYISSSEDSFSEDDETDLEPTPIVKASHHPAFLLTMDSSEDDENEEL